MDEWKKDAQKGLNTWQPVGKDKQQQNYFTPFIAIAVRESIGIAVQKFDRRKPPLRDDRETAKRHI